MDANHREETLQATAETQPAAEGPGELERVFREHHEKVFRAACRITGNASDAEDVLQTVFLRLLRRRGGSALRDNPGAYLHRAAVNAALDVIRSRKAGRSTPLESVEAVLPEDRRLEPDRRQEGREIHQRLREAAAALSPKAAEIFALRYFEGYGNHEIARMLGTSRTTVAVILHRARNRLQRELQAFAGEMT